VAPGAFQRLRAVTGQHHRVVGLEQFAQHFAIDRVVVGDQHFL